MLRKSPGLLALLVAGVWLLAPSVWAQPIGVIDQPTAGQTVSGVVKVSGFVLDFNAIDKIELLVDGNFANRADTNLPRADVLEVATAPLPAAWALAILRSVFLRLFSIAASSTRSILQFPPPALPAGSTFTPTPWP